MNFMTTINVANDFYHRLTNRDKNQGDGRYNAVEFRKTFLNFLDDKDKWLDNKNEVVLDFNGVKKLGPSFANEAFAYFTQYAKPEDIKKKIKFKNITNVKMKIIETELETGYVKKGFLG